MLKIALLCGGPSQERGISLNSARCFLDHAPCDIVPIYLNQKGDYYLLEVAQLYSNTPADFDFKLASMGKHLDERALLDALHGADLVFPLIHGLFGEDGRLQALLEKEGIAFAGSASRVCKSAFNKCQAREKLAACGFDVLPWSRIETREALHLFWEQQKPLSAIVKPSESGSSIGVIRVHSQEEAWRAAEALREGGFGEILIEPYCEDREFTVCVLENPEGRAVSLIPLEISMQGEGILDYRRKYLPTEGTRYYCPPRFSKKTTEAIRNEAMRLFRAFGLCDFARIDGFVSNEGRIRFSDLNPISGMEQNSFLFQQAARIGLSHSDLIAYLVKNALRRHGKKGSFAAKRHKKNKPVFVLTGGQSSERQVALMSGTNVWLKLQAASCNSSLFLWDGQEAVWQLPYSYSLHHTVEEVMEHCLQAEALQQKISPLVQRIRQELLLEEQRGGEQPERLGLDAFLAKAKQEGAFVFLCLHGGHGEDGTLQERLEEEGIAFNGSGSLASRICMDKHKTARAIAALNDPMILSMPQISFQPFAILPDELWREAIATFKTQDLLIKPQCDGCSTGVVRLQHLQDLKIYLEHLRTGKKRLAAHTLNGQCTEVELPVAASHFLLEPYIETDRFAIEGAKLRHNIVSGWCEMTIGVLERQGLYSALNPSITVAENHVLSVEEKFQGGTGINITPPPEEVLSSFAKEQVCQSAAQAAKALSIQNYARLDLFVECATGKIRVIEANTLPALTPSTVFYHQALSITPPLPPRELLVQLIESAEERCSRQRPESQLA